MRMRAVRRIRSVQYWQHIALALLTLATGGTIIWAMLAVFQQPCRSGASFIGACPLLISDLMPLLVAVGFLAVGIVIWLALEQELITIIFFLIGGILAAGKLGALGNDTGGRLFYFFLAWCAPVIFYFHYTLLEDRMKYIGLVVLTALVGSAFILSTPFLLWSVETLREEGWFAFLRLQVRFTLFISVLFSVFLLFRYYRNNPVPLARRRIRLILFGTILAVAPVLLLSVLPSTLGASAYVPYEFTFPWLFLLPLFYLYAFFRHRLRNAEATLNHAAVYYLLITLLLSFYLSVTVVLSRLIVDPQRWLFTFAIVNTCLVLVFAPLQKGVQRLTNWVWYSEEKSYIELIEKLTGSLSLALDRETLRHLLVEELCTVMRLSRFALLLKNEDNRLQLLDSIGLEIPVHVCRKIPLSGALISWMETAVTPLTQLQIRETLSADSLTAEEELLVACQDIAWWVPFISAGKLQGLLLLAERPGGDFFTFEDIRILTVLSRHSGVAAHNVRLIEQVRSGRKELARAHQQLLAARDREQKRLANELHDVTVQQLIGITYQLKENERAWVNNKNSTVQPFSHTFLTNIQQEILDVASQLRGVIGALRPAGLEELGLTTALQGYLARLMREEGPQLPELIIEMAEIGPQFPAEKAITLFRIVQESLRNIIRHAQAKTVTIRLTLMEDGVRLLIADDGRGFRVPVRLSELTNDEHYGLVGMAERVSWSKGQFNIRSTQGRGTEIKVFIPHSDVNSL